MWKARYLTQTKNTIYFGTIKLFGNDKDKEKKK